MKEETVINQTNQIGSGNNNNNNNQNLITKPQQDIDKFHRTSDRMEVSIGNRSSGSKWQDTK